MISLKIIIITLIILIALAAIAVYYLKRFSWFANFYPTKEETEIFNYTFMRGNLRINNVAGNITIEPHNENQIEIIAIKKAPEKALKNLFVQIIRKENEIIIKTEIPRFRSLVGSIDLTIKVPNALDLISIKTAASRILINDIDAPIEIDCAAGTVNVINSTSNLKVKVAAGTIDVIQKDIPANAKINLESAAGTVNITLPQNINARINAETAIGAVDSEFEELNGDRAFPYVGTQIRGMLGTGEASIKLKAATGAIKIKKYNKELYVYDI